MTAPIDDASFNDPDAWGYCGKCDFLVAKFRETDVLFDHETSVEFQRVACSGKTSSVPTGPEIARRRMDGRHLEG